MESYPAQKSEKALTWNNTVEMTLADSYLAGLSNCDGSATELASSKKKIDKYSCLPLLISFSPSCCDAGSCQQFACKIHK